MRAKKNSVIHLNQGNYCGTLLPSNSTNAPSINFPALLIVRGNGGGISITTMVMGSWLMTKKHDGEKGNVRKPRCRLAFLSSCLHVFCFPPVPTFAHLFDSALRERRRPAHRHLTTLDWTRLTRLLTPLSRSVTVILYYQQGN